MGNNIHIASGPNEEAITVPQLFAGDQPAVATQDVLIPLALGAIPQYTPLSWDDTGNAYKVWAAGEKVKAIAAYDIPDSASDQRAAVYIAGMFNQDAITWPGGTTEAQIADAQEAGLLRFRKLLSSDHR